MARSPASERFLAAARWAGVEVAVTRYPDGTRTASDAAAAIGCDVAQIVKSLVFSAPDGPVLALTSGANRVDTDALGRLHGGPIGRADAQFVRDATGYAIGGTPPFGHERRLPTYLDADLGGHDVVWAAAGTPDTVFPIDPRLLVRVADAVVAEFARPEP